MRYFLAVLALPIAVLDPRGVGAVTITCDNRVTRDMCGEYTVPSEQEAVPLWKTCVERGGSPYEGAHCSAAPACTQQSGGMSVKTYDYGLPEEKVRAFCLRMKGEFYAG